MSYDFSFFRVPDGEDASVVYQQFMEERELENTASEPLTKSVDGPTLSRMRGVADALKAWHPRLQEFAAEPPLRLIGLTDDDLQLQFSIGDKNVEMNVPYFRERVHE